MRKSSCIRRLGDGDGSETKRFHRFLANDKVSLQSLIESWAEQTGPAAAGRHVLAIQDTSEIKFRTTPEHRRGLGEVGKGNCYGALLHVMLAVDADTEECLGPVSGTIWTRAGRVSVPHAKRPPEERESSRWLETAETARQVLPQAAMVTVVADREADQYIDWATLPAPNFHLLTRVMKDRRLADGGLLSQSLASQPPAAVKVLSLPQGGPNRRSRTATVELRFTKVCIRRPDSPFLSHLPKSVSLTLVEVHEPSPPPGVKPIHWRLLTTHDVADVDSAWRIVGWYTRRWIIEQLFRVLKRQGLDIEASQIEEVDTLLKLIAIATKAAAVCIQLTQARDGRSQAPATVAFSPLHIYVLVALNRMYEAKTARQKNPHPRGSLAWAAWIIARLGGWDGYRSSRPPGPITFKHGLERFHAIATGWELRDVSIL